MNCQMREVQNKSLTRSLDLQFEERVDVLGEEACVQVLPIVLGPLVVVPDLVDLLESVAEFQSFVQLEGRPDSSQASLLVCVAANLKSKQNQWFVKQNKRMSKCTTELQSIRILNRPLCCTGLHRWRRAGMSVSLRSGMGEVG